MKAASSGYVEKNAAALAMPAATPMPPTRGVGEQPTDCGDEIMRRYRLRMRHEQRRAARVGQFCCGHQRIDEVVDVEEAAAVVERGERQRQRRVGKPREAPEASACACAVD